VVKPQVLDEHIRIYGDVAVYSTVMRLADQYGEQGHEGNYRALVVLVKRDGRWQQVASQLTRVAAPK
jgi:hypothetical protein